MGNDLKKINAFFFRTAEGREPVREWLKELPTIDRREIGRDIATVEYGWPIGMPVCRPLGSGLWEVRSSLVSRRIARVIFTISSGRMVLLHGFIKKTRETPDNDLYIARKRKKEINL